MKTPEQVAEEHANLRCPEQGPEFIVWCMCRDDFLAGYQAAKDTYKEAILAYEDRIKKHLPLLPMLIWFIFSCILLWGVEMKEQKSPWKLCVDEMPSDNQLLYALVEKGNKKKIVLGKYINKNWELPDSNDYGPPVYWRPFNSLPGDEEVIK